MATAPDPRRVAAERQAEANRNFRIVLTHNGQGYTFRLGEVTALDVRALREAAGTNPVEAVNDAMAGDLTALASVIFLARRQEGGSPSWAEIAGTLTMGDTYVIDPVDTAEPAEQFPDPPA